MDNNQVGGTTVEVYPHHPEELLQKNVARYVKKYRDLVEMERQEEMDRHLQEIKSLSGREREKRGRAILNLKGRDEGEGYGGKHLIKFLRQYSGEELPETEINVGDLVMLNRNKPLNPDNPTGTVVEKTRYSITVVFDEQPPSFLYKKGLRLDLYVNDITFQRMLDALEKVSKADGRLKELREIILGEREPKFNKVDQIELEFGVGCLNDSQKEAVIKARLARDFFLIHGPPGTGKTMTSIEVINQAVENGKGVLACADSNTAVDNMVERLVERKLNVVRIGHPARVTPLLREHTIDYLLLKHPDFLQSKKIRDQAGGLMDKQDNLTHPSGRWRRGMSNKQILKLARQNRGSRGVPKKKISEMADWLKIQQEIDQLFVKINKLEEKAVKDLLTGADVVCTTNSTAGSEMLKNYHFELVVIDEATQATEPAVLIPICLGDKVVMAGDHKQLPPTILNQGAEKKGLSHTLFERLLDLHGNEISSLLRVQYRMHNLIMGFPNKQFYNRKLKAADGVGNQKLDDLNIDIPEGKNIYETAFYKSTISFLDTCNLNAREKSRGDSYSYENPVEAKTVVKLVEVILKSGLSATDIAIISPYKDQVNLIEEKINNEKLEIDTVDGFQGREKEVVIFSCVRSNQDYNIGFLQDLRRLNVAITRARKRLIMIGNSNTITTEFVYKELVNYIQKKGYYVCL